MAVTFSQHLVRQYFGISFTQVLDVSADLDRLVSLHRTCCSVKGIGYNMLVSQGDISVPARGWAQGRFSVGLWFFALAVRAGALVFVCAMGMDAPAEI